MKLQVVDFFANLVKRVSPKSYTQALAEVTVTRRFLENFSGDSVWPPGVKTWVAWLFAYVGLIVQLPISQRLMQQQQQQAEAGRHRRRLPWSRCSMTHPHSAWKACQDRPA